MFRSSYMLHAGLQESASRGFGGCHRTLVFVGLLYSPFGFGTIGQLEEWLGRAYLDGFHRHYLYTEITQRYWMLVPHTAATILSSESFHGFNLFYAGCLWGKLVFLFGVLRGLKVRTLYAFLITMLYLRWQTPG